VKLDAQALGVVQRRDAVNVQKLASAINTGQVIETVDGRRFRVIAKTAGANGVSFRLNTPVESFYVTASGLADMDPLPRGLARLAHVLRFYAYNKDFTEYVNAAIQAHGLPVDPQMNWSKWLYKFASTYLSKGKPDEELLDETLHQFIIDLIFEKDILSTFKPRARKQVERNKNQPLERRVSIFLMQQFVAFRSMAVRTLNQLQTTIPGAMIKTDKSHSGIREKLDTPMIQPGEGGEDVNVIDTPEHAHQPKDSFSEEESWEDIAYFRREYGEWLVETQRGGTAENILKLFDIIIYEERIARDDVTKSSDIGEKWMKATGKSPSYYQLIATKLSETIQKFVEGYPELAETSLIARLIGDIKAKKPTTKHKVEGPKSVPVAASLNLVAIAPSELAQIPGDTGRLPHNNTGNEGNAVILLDEKPPAPPRTVAPEIPEVRHGF
jgi:hypothetical protein